MIKNHLAELIITEVIVIKGNINIDYVESHANFPSIIQMSQHSTQQC